MVPPAVYPIHAHFRDVYKDEYTAEKLPKAWVEEAIQEELEYFNAKVWTRVRNCDARRDPESQNDRKQVGNME